jgi:hypothetical protein
MKQHFDANWKQIARWPFLFANKRNLTLSSSHFKCKMIYLVIQNRMMSVVTVLTVLLLFPMVRAKDSIFKE